MTLTEQLAKFEHDALKKALEKSQGNISTAAEGLGIAYSTMQDKIRRMYPELSEYAEKLRERSGQPKRGRPAARDGALSKKRVRAAWKKHKTISGVAAELEKPTATVRYVLIEYGLHKPDER